MLYLRGKTWWIEYRRNGKQIRYSTGLKFEEKSKAETVAATVRLALSEARPPRAGIEALLDQIYSTAAIPHPIAESWAVYDRLTIAAGRVPNKQTYNRRRGCWSQFADIVRELGVVDDLRRVTRADAVGYAKKLADSGLKDKTRRNVIGEVTTVWNALAGEYNLPRIFEGLRPIVRDAEVRPAFSLKQEAAIFTTAKKLYKGRWLLPSLIARWTGLRYSDICNLEWGDIGKDWVLRLEPNKTRSHGIRVVIPIVEPLRSALAEAKTRATSPMVCPDHHRLGGGKSDKQPFSAVLDEAKVRGPFSFHSWRHTFRTRLAEAGVSDDIAKRLGGWTVDATAERYDHAERIDEARTALEKSGGAGVTA